MNELLNFHFKFPLPFSLLYVMFILQEKIWITFKWANQLKLCFNPDPFKKVQEVILSHKIKKQNNPALIFNENQEFQTISQKHFGVFWTLNWALTNIHTQSSGKCSLRKMYLELSRNSQENFLAQLFSWNFAKFLRAPFFTKHLRRLLLNLNYIVSKVD